MRNEIRKITPVGKGGVTFFGGQNDQIICFARDRQGVDSGDKASVFYRVLSVPSLALVKDYLQTNFGVLIE